MQLNASRIEVLQAQDDLVKSMMESARKELLYLSQDHQSYKKLLRILIVQVSRLDLHIPCHCEYEARIRCCYCNQ
jgi:hypothetical protein